MSNSVIDPRRHELPRPRNTEQILIEYFGSGKISDLSPAAEVELEAALAASLERRALLEDDWKELVLEMKRTMALLGNGVAPTTEQLAEAQGASDRIQAVHKSRIPIKTLLLTDVCELKKRLMLKFDMRQYLYAVMEMEWYNNER